MHNTWSRNVDIVYNKKVHNQQRVKLFYNGNVDFAQSVELTMLTTDNI